MNKKGFTLVELLLAMTFFSFILLFVISGFIQINRSYTRGIVVRRVQNSARLIVEDIARSLRGADDATRSYSPVNRLCIGDLRYAWNQNIAGTSNFTNEKFTDNTEFTIVKDYNGTCGLTFSSNTSTLLLDENVKVQYLRIDPINSTSWSIEVTVSSSNDSDLTEYGQFAKCAIGVGDQFCDIANLKTVVSLRN